MIYLDHAAATPIAEEVLEAMLPYLRKEWGNASSSYQFGQRARAALDRGREDIADVLGCSLKEVFFTGSGTEANAWAIRGIVDAYRKSPGVKPHILVSTIEHSSVIESALMIRELGDADVEMVPVDADGMVDVSVLTRMIRPETILVSIMYVNNEVGTVQRISEIASVCREKGVKFHTDACQATPYFDISIPQLGVDLMTMNASKVYGPKGIGVLYIREGTLIAPLIPGGGQELKMRGGTEFVAGALGMGVAIRRAQNKRVQESERLREIRDRLWQGLYDTLGDRIHLSGRFENRSPANLHFSIDGVNADLAVLQLDMKGICVSTGSACSSGATEPSHVLLAMGYSQQRSKECFRMSLGELNSADQIPSLVQAFCDL